MTEAPTSTLVTDLVLFAYIGAIAAIGSNLLISIYDGTYSERAVFQVATFLLVTGFAGAVLAFLHFLKDVTKGSGEQ